MKKPTLRSLKKKCWALFSEWIRRKDADEGGTVSCYTCGKLMFWKEAHAGHAIGGRHNAVLFDPEIVRPQCVRDNVMLGGKYQVFITRLIKENGLSWWEAKLTDSNRVVKYTRTDLEDLIKDLKQKLETIETRSA